MKNPIVIAAFIFGVLAGYFLAKSNLFKTPAPASKGETISMGPATEGGTTIMEN